MCENLARSISMPSFGVRYLPRISELEEGELSWQEFPKDCIIHVLTKESRVSVLAILSRYSLVPIYFNGTIFVPI